MNARIYQLPIRCCAGCGKPLRRFQDEVDSVFRRRVNCGPECRNLRQWQGLLEYEVTQGIEMDFGEMAAIAGVSKQRIFQVYEVAIRKFARAAALARLREVLDG